MSSQGSEPIPGQRGRSRRDSQDSQRTVGVVGQRAAREDDTTSIMSRSRNFSTASFATTGPSLPEKEKKKGLSALSGLLRRKPPSIPNVEVPGTLTSEISFRISRDLPICSSHNECQAYQEYPILERFDCPVYRYRHCAFCVGQPNLFGKIFSGRGGREAPRLWRQDARSTHGQS